MYRSLLGILLPLLLAGCTSHEPSDPPPADPVLGCDGQPYPTLDQSPYIVPFPPSTTVETGLTNCSSSFHGADRPDRYATDFDMPEGTPFTAARGGTVHSVREDTEGGSGNWVLIDHGDGTMAYYAHSPNDGVLVEVGERVEPGDALGLVGRTGLAGYPHLHFVVVRAPGTWPYDSVPVSFRNVDPPHTALETGATYRVLQP
jgi:murein DD-endopeptidase MepM/ murein hydrolase activator NlpD